MLLILITAIVIGIGVALYLINRDNGNIGDVIGSILIFIGGFVLLIELFVLTLTYASMPSDVASNEKRYESLTYQYDNDLYDNDNDVGKKELMKEIQGWNEDLAWRKSACNSIWIGWFVPDELAEFNYIELREKEE
jgi:hypothetical protein